jgi:DNA invertase Pin-like site-specific DNA recombinase
VIAVSTSAPRLTTRATACPRAALDRLGRHLLEAVRCRAELKALGVPLHSVRDGGEVPDLVANVLVAVAQDEQQRRRERMWAAYRHVLASG